MKFLSGSPPYGRGSFELVFGTLRKMDQMLTVKNLMVFFENALALNDLSLDVWKGEIVGVLGSNSAGKTTLMNTVSV
jgi:ABC-type uncharacterized transport system ATPase subunit